MFALAFPVTWHSSSAVVTCEATKAHPRCHTLAGATTSSSHLFGLMVALLLLALPLLTSIYLTWRARRVQALT